MVTKGTRRSSVREIAAQARIVTETEFSRQVRRKGWLIVTLAVPVILLLLLVAIPGIRAATDSGDRPAAVIGYVDLSSRVLDSFDGRDEFSRVARYASRDGGVAALASGSIRDLFVVSADYPGDNRVEWLYTGRARTAREGAAARFSRFLRTASVAEVSDPELTARLLDPGTFERVRVTGEAEDPEADGEVGGAIVSVVFGLLLMLSIIIGGATLLQSVTEEKENRMIEVLITSVSPVALLAGKVAALGGAALLQVAVWAGSVVVLVPLIARQVPDISSLSISPGYLVLAFTLFVAGYLLISLTMAGVGAAVTSAQEGASFAMLFTLPTLAPMYMLKTFLERPDSVLPTTLSMMPFTGPMSMMLRLGVSDVPAWQVGVCLLTTLGAAGLALWVSARVFRAGLLMYGQRMSLRALSAALRQAG